MVLPDVISQWVDAFTGTFDPAPYLGLFTDDVVVTDAESGHVAHGKAELADVVAPFTHLSDMTPTVLRHGANDDVVFLEVALTAATPSGDQVTSRGVTVFTLEGSKIAAVSGYMFRENVKLD